MSLLYLTFLNCLGYVVLDANVIEMVKWEDVEHSGCGLHKHFLWVVVVTLIFYLDSVESGENFLFIHLCCLFQLVHSTDCTQLR
jgi:hypothetical protein